MRTVIGRGRVRARAVAGLASAVVLAMAVAACSSAPSSTGTDSSSPAGASAGDPGSASGADPAQITYRTAPPTQPVDESSAGEAPQGSGPDKDPSGTVRAAADQARADADQTTSTDGATAADGAGQTGTTPAATGSTSVSTGGASSSGATTATAVTTSQAPPKPAATSFTGLHSSVSTAYGTPVTLDFGLVSGHRTVAGADATVRYADQAVTVHLDGKGQGSAQLSDLPMGDTEVQLAYAGDARHRPASAKVTVSVTRRHTEIRSLTVASATVTVNQTVTVTLGDDVAIGFDVVSGGEPVTDQKGTIAYDGTEKSIALDADGHASATLSDLPVGQHQVIVRYAGDKTRDGAGAPFTISVTDPEAQQADDDADAQNSDDADSSSDSDSDDSTSQQPDNPCPAYARACVNLSNSTTWLQSGGQIVYGPVPMMSGRPGYRTPSGTFQVYWKDKDHRSRIFNDAPMPNSVFFVGGVAFHEGSLSVTSHGCIHLSWDASQAYWDFLRGGDTVYVFGYAPY